MRERYKDCAKCGRTASVLFRCKFQNNTGWVFLCNACLNIVKKECPDTYHYGGTWKSKKK
ncbi:MAG: hypothetical protein CMM57_02190 [Rhodospirillaceae bacterium]|nr:hypothetical protein [Rhodospirillaceae bacterium]